MTRRPLLVLFVVLSIASIHAASAPQPTFRAGGDAVRVFVTVTDRDGRLLTTLTREQFEIRDEGTPQPITLFDNTPQPIRLIVMLDVSGSMAGNLPLLREASLALIPRLRPDDRVKIGSFGHQVTLSERFTRDAVALGDDLPRTIDPDAPTPLWSAVDRALDGFGDGDTRKVVLVLSDGQDTGPIRQTSLKRAVGSQAQVIDRAGAEDVMIYAVGMRSRRAQSSQPGAGPGGLRGMLTMDLPDPGLARVAEETGGGYIEIRLGQDLGEALTRVADELHSQYLLGFGPPKRDGKVHDLDVRVSQPGAKPRARKTYVAPRS